MKPVAALYIDEATGPYIDREGVYPWGVTRDARSYGGPDPVVAHPPCGHWCRFSWNCKRPLDEKWMGPAAVAAVRAYGGVLEHPAHSKLWPYCGMPKPGHCDRWGHTVELDQVWFGHEARKRTWLYVCGVSPVAVAARLDAAATLDAEPTRVMGVPRSKGRTLLCLPKSRRHITPEPFADWLIGLARTVPS